MARIVITALILLASASSALAARTYPQIKTLYTMSGCAPCAKVEAKLVKDGFKVCVLMRPSDSPPKEASLGFPTIVYSDGHKDNGERIMIGRYSSKPLVAAIKWQPKD